MMNAIRNVRLANFQIAQRKSAAAEKAAKQARDDACIIEMRASHAWCRAPGARHRCGPGTIADIKTDHRKSEVTSLTSWIVANR